MRTILVTLLLLSVCTSLTAAQQSLHTRDGKALRDLYRKMDGNTWQLNYQNSWMSIKPICVWQGVSCGPFPERRVIALDLTGMGLVGALPESVGNWDQLKELKLGGNFISSLPAAVASWGALTEIDLSSNELKSLPAAVGNWKALRRANFDSNELTELPESVGNWDSVESVSLSKNQLSHLPESCASWPVRALNIMHNKFRELPSASPLWSDLLAIYAQKNHITELPPSVGSWTSLLRADFSSNALSSLPDEAAAWGRTLLYARFSLNNFTSIPKGAEWQKGEQFNISLVFQEIDFAHNQLSALSAAAVTAWGTAVKVDISYNQISSLPSAVGSLNPLSFDASHNLLSSLPGSIDQWQNIEELLLSHNGFTQPPNFGSNLKINYIDLGYNAITACRDGDFQFQGGGPEYLNMQSNPMSIIGCLELKTGIATLDLQDCDLVSTAHIPQSVKVLLIDGNRMPIVDTHHMDLVILSAMNQRLGPTDDHAEIIVLGDSLVTLRVTNFIPTAKMPYLQILDVSGSDEELKVSRHAYPFLSQIVATNVTHDNCAWLSSMLELQHALEIVNVRDSPGLSNCEILVAEAPTARTVFGNLNCPQWIFQRTENAEVINGGVLITEWYFQNADGCECPKGFLWVNEPNSAPGSVAGACEDCRNTPLVSCDTQVRLPSQSHLLQPTLASGFYPALPDGKIAPRSRWGVDAILVRCVDPSLCLFKQWEYDSSHPHEDAVSGGFRCASDRDSSSFLCSRCISGKFAVGSQCYDCIDGVYQWAGILAVVLLTGGLMTAVWTQRPSRTKDLSLIIDGVLLADDASGTYVSDDTVSINEEGAVRLEESDPDSSNGGAETSGNAKKSKWGGAIGIIVFWGQLVGLVMSGHFTQGASSSDSGSSFSGTLQTPFQYISVALLSFTPVSLQCFDDYSYDLEFSVMWGLVALMLLICLIIYCILRYGYKQRGTAMSIDWSYMVQKLVLLTYFPLTTRVLQTFNCESVSENADSLSYMAAYPYERCPDKTGYVYVMSVVLLVVFTAGVPVWLLLRGGRSSLLLHGGMWASLSGAWKRKATPAKMIDDRAVDDTTDSKEVPLLVDEQPATDKITLKLHATSALLSGVRVGAGWWSTFVFVRSLTLGCLLALTPVHDYEPGVGIFVVVLASILLVMRFHPYEQKSDNLLAVLLLFHGLVVLLSSLLYRLDANEDAAHNTDGNNASEPVYMSVVNFVVLVSLLVYLIIRGRKMRSHGKS